MIENGTISNSPRQNLYGPVTPSEMFERTFALLRENPGLFFGIVLVLIGVEIVVGGVLGGSGLWMGRYTTASAPIARALFVIPVSLLGAAIIYLFAQIIQGALFLASQAKLAGASMTVGEACRLAAEKAGTLVGISILVALRIFGYMLLFYFVLAIPVGIVAIASGITHAGRGISFHPGAGRLLGLGIFFALLLLVFLLVYLAATLWLVVRYAVAIPAALAENLPVTDSIRRSIQLSRGSKGRLYSLFVAVGCVWIVHIAAMLPVQLMAVHAARMHGGVHVGAFSGISLLSSGFRILLSWVLVTFTGVALTICYYDLRARKEGFGGEAAVAVLEIPPTVPPAVPTANPPDWPIEDIPVS